MCSNNIMRNCRHIARNLHLHIVKITYTLIIQIYCWMKKGWSCNSKALGKIFVCVAGFSYIFHKASVLTTKLSTVISLYSGNIFFFKELESIGQLVAELSSGINGIKNWILSCKNDNASLEDPDLLNSLGLHSVNAERKICDVELGSEFADKITHLLWEQDLLNFTFKDHLCTICSKMSEQISWCSCSVCNN